MDQQTITWSNLENPPEWLTCTVNYLKNHAKETSITPKALAQKWEAKVGRTKSVRLRFAGNLLRRPITTFKELSQGEINALSEICEWIPQRDHADEGNAARRNVRR
jgi:hypothetical protein